MDDDFTPPSALPCGWSWYLGEYTREGRSYSIEVPGPDWESAEAALAEVYETGFISGRLLGHIDIPPEEQT